MVKVSLLLAAMALLSGCAAIAPLGSLISAPTGPPPLQVHEQTSVKLAQDNFLLVKTNVLGRSRGFSLLGIITIVPATLTKAMSRLYENAQMQPGRPETVAHLVIEQTSSYYILFGVPEVDARADVVEFRSRSKESLRPEPATPEPIPPPPR
jgi:hypothetical protein